MRHHEGRGKTSVHSFPVGGGKLFLYYIDCSVAFLFTNIVLMKFSVQSTDSVMWVCQPSYVTEWGDYHSYYYPFTVNNVKLI